MTANQSPQELSAAPDTVLRWHERLQFKLGLLFALLLVLVATVLLPEAEAEAEVLLRTA